MMKLKKYIKAAVFCWAVFVCVPAFALNEAERQEAQKIADHFASQRTMTGDFVQIGPRGERAEGTFYMERPGKIRFAYKTKSKISIIADGKSLVINNKQLDTWDMYQLKQTPLKLILDEKMKIKPGQLLDYQATDDTITLTLSDKTMRGEQIKMVFDAQDYALRQWIMVDKQKLETTVTLSNVRSGVRFADGMFKIDYQRIAMKKKGKD